MLLQRALDVNDASADQRHAAQLEALACLRDATHEKARALELYARAIERL